MAYFTDFPIALYDLTNSSNKSLKLVSNLFVRTRFLPSIENESTVFYKYQISDGDTPEILASKYYGNSNRHWIILLANNITDPTYDWPLTYTNFSSYVENKYGSIATAKTTYHHYEKVVTKTDSVTGTITVNKYELDYNTYANLASSSTETINLKDGNTVQIVTTKNAVSYYDYEEEQNEAKREIKIINAAYALQIEQELFSILTNV
jgi:hypothetical protein